MTITQLHKITGQLIAKKKGGIDVAINFATFSENECGSILEVESAKVMRVQGADDGGPVGEKFPFLVFDGGFRQ